MSERSKEFMNKIWEARNSGADTEEKLVSKIIEILTEIVKSYTAQNPGVGIGGGETVIILEKNDILELSKELRDT
jgi:hypothetical protein